METKTKKHEPNEDETKLKKKWPKKEKPKKFRTRASWKGGSLVVSRNMAIEPKLMPGGIGDDTNIVSS